MRQFPGAAFLLSFLIATSSQGFSQLRNLSPYERDCINTDQTHFVLHEAGAADFKWASEWTHMTANAIPEKSAMFVWHFKDGTKAYARQGDFIGDAGGIKGYLFTDQDSSLEDIHRKKIQPMTLKNYPVKVELWIGEVGDATGFAPETMVDAACFDAQTIEYEKPYHFADCK